MNTMTIDIQKKSLALSIACGRSVRLWARRYDVDVETALGWSLQNEIRPLVEEARMRVADRMVGRLLRGAKVAITQLIKLCTQSASDAVRLSASRAILANWIEVCSHFNYGSRLAAVEESQDRDDAKMNEWRPLSPYPQPIR